MKLAYSMNPVSIDINLMQMRTHNRSLIVLPLLLILIAMGGASAFGWVWYETQSKLAGTKLQITEVSQSTAALKVKLKQNTFNGQLTDILKQPTLLKQKKPLTTVLLTQLNKLLPLHANVTQLELDAQGALKLTLYFATSEDIISFTQSIQASDAFKLISMGTIHNITNTVGTQIDPVTLLPETGAITKLPVYQTTFELNYRG